MLRAFGWDGVPPLLTSERPLTPASKPPRPPSSPRRISPPQVTTGSTDPTHPSGATLGRNFHGPYGFCNQCVSLRFPSPWLAGADQAANNGTRRYHGQVNGRCEPGSSRKTPWRETRRSSTPCTWPPPGLPPAVSPPALGQGPGWPWGNSDASVASCQHSTSRTRSVAPGRVWTGPGKRHPTTRTWFRSRHSHPRCARRCST